MGKRAVFAFKGITQLHNHKNASNFSVRLKFSSLLFLGMQNLVKRNAVTYGEPSRYSPGAARAAPPYSLAHTATHRCPNFHRHCLPPFLGAVRF